MNHRTNKRFDEFLPYSLVATKKWLMGKGIHKHSLDNALKSEKLIALTTGVYARHGVTVTWEGVVASLQLMSDKPVHVGGLSALELLGFGHYLSSTKQKNIHVYSEDKLPPWLSKIKGNQKYLWHGTKSIWLPEIMVNKDVVRKYDWHHELFPITVSSPEKAIIELLVDVPDSISFEHADELMQGMTSLSPKRLDLLLQSCCHVKAKRLFFWLAERQNYPWLKKIDLEKYDLGKGKRVIEKGGKLDNKYLITVPESMHGSQ